MRIIFKNCTLLDGTKDMVARENIDVAIENDKIVEIGKIEQKKEDKIIDSIRRVCTAWRFSSSRVLSSSMSEFR